MGRDLIPPPSLLNRLTRLLRFARSHGAYRAMYQVFGNFTDSLSINKWVTLQIAEVFRASVNDLKYYPQLLRRFEIRRARQDEIGALQSFFGKHTQVADRFSRQDVCIILVVNGRILAAEWLALGPNVFREDWAPLGCVFRFPAGACWLYDGLCDEENAGAFGILIACLKSHFGELTVKEVFFQIDYVNIDSITIHKDLGGRSMGKIFHFMFLGLSLTRYKTHRGRWRRLPVRAENLGLCKE